MFYNCNSLISLPDLTKWNTQNIEDITAGPDSQAFEAIEEIEELGPDETDRAVKNRVEPLFRVFRLIRVLNMTVIFC